VRRREASVREVGGQRWPGRGAGKGDVAST
jgi:hypothetical protein